jgi:hypothetical protein
MGLISECVNIIMMYMGEVDKENSLLILLKKMIIDNNVRIASCRYHSLHIYYMLNH